MVNLITRMVSMATVWRLYGDNVESDIFHEVFLSKISLEFVWGCHTENMADQITRHSLC